MNPHLPSLFSAGFEVVAAEDDTDLASNNVVVFVELDGQDAVTRVLLPISRNVFGSGELITIGDNIGFVSVFLDVAGSFPCAIDTKPVVLQTPEKIIRQITTRSNANTPK